MPIQPLMVLPDLAFLCLKEGARCSSAGNYYFLCVDHWFDYPDFVNYYGPSNLAHILRFIEIVDNLRKVVFVCSAALEPAQSPKHRNKTICVRTDSSSEQRSNAALLLACYLVWRASFSLHLNLKMLSCGYSPEAALSAVSRQPVPSYRTVGEEICNDYIELGHCLRGLHRAIEHGLLRLADIDVEQYLRMEMPENGDMNWIIPGRILAIAEPSENSIAPEQFVALSKDLGIKALIRLNRENYSAELFRKAGIQHYELFFHDGDVPTIELVERFIAILENTAGKHSKQRHLYSSLGAVAVHCKAGLGRTGTMISSYLIRQYGFDAKEVIAYLRIMRPGSILGKQVRFLELFQYYLRNERPSGALRLVIKESLAEAANALLPKRASQRAKQPAQRSKPAPKPKPKSRLKLVRLTKSRGSAILKLIK